MYYPVKLEISAGDACQLAWLLSQLAGSPEETTETKALSARTRDALYKALGERDKRMLAGAATRIKKKVRAA